MQQKQSSIVAKTNMDFITYLAARSSIGGRHWFNL